MLMQNDIAIEKEKAWATEMGQFISERDALQATLL
jgi:hypothetical protein